MSEVTLLAYTQLTDEAFDVLDVGDPERIPHDKWLVHEADHLAELAGRECYQSFHRPNPATEANVDYLAHIQEVQHFSVLAHASFTFRFTDVSRSLTHELIRHRFLAFSELSQRYVNMDDSYTVVPPLWQHTHYESQKIAEHHAASVKLYHELVERATGQGIPRKQARQAARSVLPGGTETKIVVSGNVRAWRDFIFQRNTPGADAEIHEVAGKVLHIIAQYAPNSVADLIDAEVQDA